MIKTVCKVCDGSQAITYPEIGEYVDCICTDDRWDSENQDICLECNGAGCEYCVKEKHC